MATKHVFNNPDGLVLKALRGSAALNPSLRVYVFSFLFFSRALLSLGGSAVAQQVWTLRWWRWF